ncbi:unnamed protein product [Allacma fusca]|uniref:G-protein coupled receptors family 2 profile 2 domain-containing protein n=1 Tax=Allacma fusca TaxID=39272 RepID=A0A8J2NWM0_9HEXA|nr:unnamed protein product [Allacma fusca]
MKHQRFLSLFSPSFICNNGFSSSKELQIKIQKCSENITADFWIIPPNFRSNQSESVDNGNDFMFKFDLRNTTCKDQIVMYTLSSEEDMLEIVFSADGTLSIGEEAMSVVYPVQNYCITSIGNTSVQVEVCKSNTSNMGCGTGHLCVPKCCPLGQVLKGDLNIYPEPICTEVTTDWKPYVLPLGISDDFIETSYLESQELHFKYVQHEFPKCFKTVDLLIPNSRALRPLQSEIRFYRNGEVHTKRLDNTNWTGPYSAGDFCIDGFWDSSESRNFTRNPSNQIVIACDYAESTLDPASNVDTIVIIFTIVFICLIISSVCLLATVVVYLVLWKEQNIHGWTIMTMALSQFVYFTTVAISMGVVLYYQEGIGTLWCKGIGILQHYFNMATYTWLTVLNCDLWLVIRSNKPSRYLGHGIKRFLLYSLYGFGVPLTFLCFSLSMEFHFGLMNSDIIKPEYGRESCGINTTESYYYYSVVITMLLYLITVVFAVLTVIAVIKAKKDTRRVDNANNKTNNSRLIFIAKLSVLFGFPWIFEFIFSNMTIMPLSVLYWMHVAITIINALQGVGLFWVFALQKKTKNQLNEKFCKNRKRGNKKSTAVSWTARTDSTDFSTTNNAL